MNWGSLGSFVVVLIAVLLLAPSVAADRCSVLTENGFVSDVDCDGYPDSEDNCPATPNADQYDRNRNGVGDFCDLLVEEIVIDPDNHLRQGEFAHLTLRMINNLDHPLENIKLTVKSSALAIDSSELLPYLPAGESATIDFWLYLPKCAETGSHTLAITTKIFNPMTYQDSTETQSQAIFVDSSDACNAEGGPLDTTIITMLHGIDLDRGESTLIPLEISNRGEEQATYHVVLEDLGPWGSWRVDPAASVVVPAGHDVSLFLHLDTYSHTRPGSRVIQATVTSDGQQSEIPIKVYVRAPLESRNGFVWGVIVQVFVILILLFLIIAAVVVAVTHVHKRRKKKPKKKAAKKKSTKKKAAKRKAAKRRKVAIERAAKRKRESYY